MSYIKMQRSEELDEILKHPLEFVLLAQIARRARRTDEATLKKLEIGEALIGDYQSVGMTRQQYRRCLANLQAWSLITIKPTNKGTIAKIINTSIFDINAPSNQPSNTHATNHQTRTQPTTNKKIRSKKDLFLLEDGSSLKELFMFLNKKLHPGKLCRDNGYSTKLRKRLEHFSKEEIIKAADNMLSDPFMMGDNNGQKKYASLEYLLRNDENVRKWLEKAPGKVSRLMNNLDVDNLED